MLKTILLLSCLTIACSDANNTNNGQTNNGSTNNASNNGSTATTPKAASYDRPESALWDSQKNVIYISNIGGESGVADGVGWITRLDSEGALMDDQWISGLNAPKGVGLDRQHRVGLQ